MTDDSEVARIAAGLTKVDRDFLFRVCDGMKLTCADRIEDRARQRVRRSRLAHVVQNPRRWEALPLGLRVKAYLESKGGDA